MWLIHFQGHDTTAAGSSFFLCLMGAHPDVQVRISLGVKIMSRFIRNELFNK